MGAIWGVVGRRPPSLPAAVCPCWRRWRWPPSAAVARGSRPKERTGGTPAARPRLGLRPKRGKEAVRNVTARWPMMVVAALAACGGGGGRTPFTPVTEAAIRAIRPASTVRR